MRRKRTEWEGRGQNGKEEDRVGRKRTEWEGRGQSGKEEDRVGSKLKGSVEKTVVKK